MQCELLEGVRDHIVSKVPRVQDHYRPSKKSAPAIEAMNGACSEKHGTTAPSVTTCILGVRKCLSGLWVSCPSLGLTFMTTVAHRLHFKQRVQVLYAEKQ
jgi:hypothetical protein